MIEIKKLSSDIEFFIRHKLDNLERALLVYKEMGKGFEQKLAEVDAEKKKCEKLLNLQYLDDSIPITEILNNKSSLLNSFYLLGDGEIKLEYKARLVNISLSRYFYPFVEIIQGRKDSCLSLYHLLKYYESKDYQCLNIKVEGSSVHLKIFRGILSI